MSAVCNPFWADVLADHHYVTPCNKELGRGPECWRSNLRGSAGGAAREETVPHDSQVGMDHERCINAPMCW
jgi:hypothetical protein